MAISRFDRQGGIKFNPLSMQELAYAPSLLRQREDLLQQDVTEASDVLASLEGSGDATIQDTIRGYRSNLENVAGNIISKGYTPEVAEQFRQLRRNYGKDIVPMQQYLTDRAARAKEIQQLQANKDNIITGDTGVGTYNDWVSGQRQFGQYGVQSRSKLFNEGQRIGTKMATAMSNPDFTVTKAGRELAGYLKLNYKSEWNSPDAIQQELENPNSPIRGLVLQYLQGVSPDSNNAEVQNAFIEGVKSMAWKPDETKLMSDKMWDWEQKDARTKPTGGGSTQSPLVARGMNISKVNINPKQKGVTTKGSVNVENLESNLRDETFIKNNPGVKDAYDGVKNDFKTVLMSGDANSGFETPEMKKLYEDVSKNLKMDMSNIGGSVLYNKYRKLYPETDDNTAVVRSESIMNSFNNLSTTQRFAFAMDILPEIKNALSGDKETQQEIKDKVLNLVFPDVKSSLEELPLTDIYNAFSSNLLEGANDRGWKRKYNDYIKDALNVITDKSAYSVDISMITDGSAQNALKESYLNSELMQTAPPDIYGAGVKTGEARTYDKVEDKKLDKIYQSMFWDKDGVRNFKPNVKIGITRKGDNNPPMIILRDDKNEVLIKPTYQELFNYSVEERHPWPVLEKADYDIESKVIDSYNKSASVSLPELMADYPIMQQNIEFKPNSPMGGTMTKQGDSYNYTLTLADGRDVNFTGNSIQDIRDKFEEYSPLLIKSGLIPAQYEVSYPERELKRKLNAETISNSQINKIVTGQ